MASPSGFSVPSLPSIRPRSEQSSGNPTPPKEPKLGDYFPPPPTSTFSTRIAMATEMVPPPGIRQIPAHEVPIPDDLEDDLTAVMQRESDLEGGMVAFSVYENEDEVVGGEEEEGEEEEEITYDPPLEEEMMHDPLRDREQAETAYNIQYDLNLARENVFNRAGDHHQQDEHHTAKGSASSPPSLHSSASSRTKLRIQIARKELELLKLEEQERMEQDLSGFVTPPQLSSPARSTRSFTPVPPSLVAKQSGPPPLGNLPPFIPAGPPTTFGPSAQTSGQGPMIHLQEQERMLHFYKEQQILQQQQQQAYLLEQQQLQEQARLHQQAQQQQNSCGR